MYESYNFYDVTIRFYHGITLILGQCVLFGPISCVAEVGSSPTSFAVITTISFSTTTIGRGVD